MPTLIACLSTGKGTWAEVSKIIASQKWASVHLITNQFGKEHFTGAVNFVVINPEEETSSLVASIKQQLQGKISDFEVALNFASGNGKEHMALLEAVLELGLNFRIITLTKNQVEVLSISR